MKRFLVLALLCGSLLPHSANAADQLADVELIALEIRNLSTSVDRLTNLLYDQAQQQNQEEVLRKLDIAVAYLNFRSRRIEMLERDLLNSRSMKTRLEDVMRQWEKRVNELEETGKTNTTGQANGELQTEEAKEQMKLLKQRLTRVDTEIVDFENRILELRDQLNSVESYVEKHLQL